MKRVSRIVCSLLILIVGLSVPVAAGAGLQPVERIFDFGAVGIDYLVYHNFEFINRDSVPIRIDSAYVNCDCSKVWILDSVIAPGDTGRIKLQFTTKDYYGRTSKAMQVYTNSDFTPHLECFYLSTIGQWLMGIRPNPVSVFFLPGAAPKEIKIGNPALDGVKIIGVESYNDWVTVEVSEESADKGDMLGLTVTTAEGLPKGNYYTNFRIQIEMPVEFKEPLFLTVPVKIVRY